jgi:hypothetical protein
MCFTHAYTPYVYNIDYKPKSYPALLFSTTIYPLFLPLQPRNCPFSFSLTYFCSPVIPLILLRLLRCRCRLLSHAHRARADGAATAALLLVLVSQVREVVPEALATLVKGCLSPAIRATALDESVEALLRVLASKLRLSGKLCGRSLSLFGKISLGELQW